MNTKPNDSKLVPEVQRQYSLLREFNLEQAKAGDEILFCTDYLPPLDVKFKGCTSDSTMIFVEYGSANDITGKSYYTEELKMKPLCWIEGKPVYKGDVLYKTSPYTKAFTASSAFKDIGITNTEGRWCCSKYLTWNKPTVRHFHQNLIEAWESGVEIEFLNITGEWVYASTPTWNPDHSYRIKPQKKSGWINLWKSSYSPKITTGSVYPTEFAAVDAVAGKGLIGTIEIHWEE